VFLAQQLKAAGVAVQALLGFASANAIICTDQLESIDVPVQVATDDGSFGFHGLVTSLLEQQQPAVVYTCGPLGMLAAVSRLCINRNIPCQVSLEERMGCGVGACLSCVCKTRSQDEADWHWQRVCKEGPVFSATEVAFDAMR
jgi:dihydroorotate dehydrogenase electron transfer subunit